jgi:hypothetical protein
MSSYNFYFGFGSGASNKQTNSSFESMWIHTNSLQPVHRIIELAFAELVTPPVPPPPPFLRWIQNPNQIPKNQDLYLVGKFSTGTPAPLPNQLSASVNRINNNLSETLIAANPDAININMGQITVDGTQQKFDFSLKFNCPPMGGFPVGIFGVHVKLMITGNPLFSTSVAGSFV